MNNGWNALSRWGRVVLGLLLCAMTGCRQTPGKAVIEQAYTQAEAYDWRTVLPLVKDYLVYHPRDAGAHLLLARCYLEVTPPTLAIADGELQTALELAASGGDLGPYADRLTRDQFIAFVHEKRAKMYMRGYQEGLRMSAAPEVLRRQLEHSLDEVQRGLATDSQSSVLLEMQQTLEETLAALESLKLERAPRERRTPGGDTRGWMARNSA